MAGFQSVTRIAAPPETVFTLTSDFAGAPGRIKGIKKIEMLTDGPVGVGTRFRETREMFGKEATEVMEVTAFEPNRSYTLSAVSCGARHTSVFRVEPDGEATNLHCHYRIEALSWIAWLMTPVAFLMMGMIQKCVQQDINDIKSAAESVGQVPST
jgi:hypothetical protein